jgi:hypothetical protein
MRGGMPFLLLAASLAGCSDGADPAADSATGTDQSGEGADMTTTGQDATPEPLVFDVAFDGSLGRDVCAPMGPNACVGVGELSTQSQNDLILEAPGSTRWDYDLTVTWDAATPLMQDLELHVLSMESCGDGCITGSSTDGPAAGTSPLTGSGTVTLAENETGLWVWVILPRQTPSPVYARIQTEMDFRLEGTAVAYFD